MNVVNAPELSSMLILLLKATAILLLSLLACAALRRAPASVRHGILLCALAAVVLSPLSLLIPRKASFLVKIPFSPVGFAALTPFPSPADGRGGPDTGAAFLDESSPTVTPLPSAGEGKGVRAANPKERKTVPSPASTPYPSLTTDHRPLTTASALVAAYLAGVLTILLRFVLSLIRVRRWYVHAAPFDAAEMADVRRRMGLSGKISVRCSEGVAAPMMFGWRRPAILLPGDAPEWPAERRAAALLHEAAHIARRDWPALIFAHWVCVLGWFHPLVWVVAARLRAEAERAADDRVLLAGIPAPDYARHLLEIAHSLTSARSASSAALAMADAPPMERRLRALLDNARPRRASRRAVITLMTAAVAVFSFFALARPQAEAQTPPKATPAPQAKPAANGKEAERAQEEREIERFRRANAADERRKKEGDGIRKQIQEMQTEREAIRLRLSIERITALDSQSGFQTSLVTAGSLEAQIRLYKARMQAAERALAEYRRAHAMLASGKGVINLRRQERSDIDRLSLLKQEQDYLNVNRGDMQQRMNQLRQEMAVIQREYAMKEKEGKNFTVLRLRQRLAETAIAEQTQAERMALIAKEIRKYERLVHLHRVFDITYPPNGMPLPPQGAPHRIRVEVTDEAGTRTIYDQTKKAGESVNVRSEFAGKSVSLRIYDNGELKGEVNK